MRAFVLQLSLLCLAASTADCGAEASAPEASTGRLTIAADPAEPVRRGTNTFVVEVRDTRAPHATSDGAPVEGAHVDVVPSMPSMGHGSPVSPTVQPLGGGRYRVDAVVFNMPGTWEVRYRVTAGDAYDHAAFRYEVP